MVKVTHATSLFIANSKRMCKIFVQGGFVVMTIWGEVDGTDVMINGLITVFNMIKLFKAILKGACKVMM